jgi:hypothetical protein
VKTIEAIGNDYRITDDHDPATANRAILKTSNGATVALPPGEEATRPITHARYVSHQIATARALDALTTRDLQSCQRALHLMAETYSDLTDHFDDGPELEEGEESPEEPASEATQYENFHDHMVVTLRTVIRLEEPEGE